MTTNVFDGGCSVVATDSRWSKQVGKWLIYIDDARFEKLELYKSFCFVFAGSGRVIQQWKSWIQSSPTDFSTKPGCDGISVCIVNTTDKSVLFTQNEDIVKDNAYFYGSGARHAYRCWDANRDPKKAVETAKSFDACTGGDVKFIDMKSMSHNLHQVTKQVSLQMVEQALDSRGMVMELNQGMHTGNPPFKLADVASSDKELLQAKEQLSSGAMSLEAPCDGMYSEWSKEQKDKLDDALKIVFSM